MVKKKIVKKKITKKSNSKKIKPKEPTQSQLFTKVSAVSESTKTISKEIKNMGKIFKENQRILLSMNNMIDTKMTQNSIVKFAKDMLAVRFPEDELRRITIDMDEFITPVRPEDKGDDLWSVFNVI